MSSEECTGKTSVTAHASDPQIDPGPTLTDLQWRCDAHHRFGYRYWWQPGDHPSLLARDWIATCDDCGAHFTGIYGVTYWLDHGRRGEPTTISTCLRCADADRVRHFCDVEVDA